MHGRGHGRGHGRVGGNANGFENRVWCDEFLTAVRGTRLA